MHIAIAAARTHACELREGAAAKAVAAVRRERYAHVLAERRLGLGAVSASEQAFVVNALDFGLERIAASAPLAVVIASAISKVEVAVRFALLAGFTADSGEQLFAFVVVAGPEAFGVVVVDEAVTIIVDAVAARGDASVALDESAIAQAGAASARKAAEVTCRAVG